MARVDLANLTKVYQEPGRPPVAAVQDLSLAVADGELLALVGPSGCGKTTTLRLIAGLETPTAGTIALDSRDVHQLDPAQRDVAMVFQNPALYPHLNVRQNLELPLKARRVPGPEIRQRVAEAAELLGLTAGLDRLPRSLSGGERQRVALGRALVRRPGVFLLDEPLTHLDGALRFELRAELVRLQRQLRATMIYVTHDHGEALALGQRVAVLQAGALQQVGSPSDIYRYPDNLFVAGFVGSLPMNIFPGILVGQGDALAFQVNAGVERGAGGAYALPLPPTASVRLRDWVGKELRLGLRAEDLELEPEPVVARESATMDARVTAIEYQGQETFLHVHVGAVRVAARVRQEVRRELVGQTVAFRADLWKAHLYDPATGAAVCHVERGLNSASV